MANLNFNAPGSAPDSEPPNAFDAQINGDGRAMPQGNAPNASARSATPLDRLGQSERAENQAQPDSEPGHKDPASAALYDERERAQSMALYESNAALDVGDDTAMREFYARLVTLLTQDGEAEGTSKKGRGTLMTALRRRWLPALIVSGLAFFGLFSVLKPRQATFSASTTLLLPPREAAGNKDPFAPPEDSYDTQAQLAIIGSEKIVRSAMAKVPTELKKKGWGNPPPAVVPVGVSALESDSLINISTSSHDPRASLRLVEEMERAYAQYTRSRYTSTRTSNLSSTRKRVQVTQAALDKAQRELRDYKERTGIFDAQSQQSSSSTNISELQNALSAARREAAAATADDATLQSLRQRVVDANAKLQNILRDFEPESERARLAQAEVNGAQAQSRARENQLSDAAAQRVAQLEGSLAAARRAAADLPAAEQELNRLNARVALADAAYRSASTRADQLDLASGAAVPTATSPRSPSVQSDLPMQEARSLAVSLLGALALGFLAALGLDRLDHSVRAARDPKALFEAPILGALPAVRARGALFIGNAQARGSARARTAIIEACYNAQSHILSAAAAVGARSILVTSSLPEEGKSQCAANLAAAMAYGGRQVLLIDADFWHPSQNEILETELAPGYAQVLRDELPLSQAIRATQVPNLHLLTAGQQVEPRTKNKPGNSAEMSALLSGEGHFHTMEVLKRFFDVIVLDAPPVMSVSDAQLLAGLSDATVLVVADRTNRNQVQRARSMLRLAGAVLLGAVINSVRLGEVQRWNVDFSPEEPFSNYGTALTKR